jgi:hypothetical protein
VYPKLATLILAFGAIACILLVVRQQRIQTAHELVQVQRQVGELDRRLWKFRIEIAQRMQPHAVDQAISMLGPMHPIPHAYPTPMSDRDVFAGLRILHDRTTQRADASGADAGGDSGR